MLSSILDGLVSIVATVLCLLIFIDIALSYKNMFFPSPNSSMLATQVTVAGAGGFVSPSQFIVVSQAVSCESGHWNFEK